MCCVALPCCLFDLTCFFLSSFLLSSLIKTCVHISRLVPRPSPHAQRNTRGSNFYCVLHCACGGRPGNEAIQLVQYTCMHTLIQLVQYTVVQVLLHNDKIGEYVSTQTHAGSLSLGESLSYSASRSRFHAGQS